MADSIAATSLIGCRPMCRDFSVKDVSKRKKYSNNCRVLPKELVGRRLVKLSVQFPVLKADKSVDNSIKKLAVELTREAYAYREEHIMPVNWDNQDDTDIGRKPALWPPDNQADNPSLHNPLLRQERMGCGWSRRREAWIALAEEEGRSPPPAFILRRLEGMKNEQAISEVLCWSRDSAELRRMGARKEEIYQALHGGVYNLRTGTKEFVNVLMNYNIPMALVSTRPRKVLETAIGMIGIEGYFTAIGSVW